MLHPFMTAELVRQRRAALQAESRIQPLVRQLQPRARTDPRAWPADARRLPHGTWTIDPTDSSVSFAWRTLWRRVMTGRLRALGIINLDDLPVVGVIRFQQPSGPPVLTMAWDPVSTGTGDAGLDAMGHHPEVADVMGSRWRTLHSQSLEILPSGAWRVMATITAEGTAGLVELHLEVDPPASRRDLLVLRGRGVLDRRAFGMGKRASIFDPKIQLDLALRARRVGTRTKTERHEGDIDNQHAGLSQPSAAHRTTPPARAATH